MPGRAWWTCTSCTAGSIGSHDQPVDDHALAAGSARGTTVVSVNDRALVAALGAGDPAGLDGAYRAYADRVYAYCRWLLDDRDAAADALVDTFVVACVRTGRLRHPERLRAWLYAVARSQCRWHAHAGHRGPSGWIEQDPRELVELVDRHG